MTRSAVAAMILLALLVPALPQGAAQGSTTLLVNVHTATPQGCGEWGGGAHYAYKVYVDGVLAHTSPVWDPVNGNVHYYELVRADLGTRNSATIGFEVVDHSFGLFGSSTHTCNLTASDATRASLVYNVGSPQLFRSSSTNEGAAIEVYVSDSTKPTPTMPTVRLVGNASADRATVAWDALDVPGFTVAQLLDPGRRMSVLAEVATAAAGTREITGLEENTAYQAQLRVTGGSWILASNALQFRTANLAPVAPSVSVAAVSNTTANVTWSHPDEDRDLRYVEFFVSDRKPWTPSNQTLALRLDLADPFAESFFSSPVTLSGLRPDTSYELIVRATDDHGATGTTGILAFRTTLAGSGGTGAGGSGPDTSSSGTPPAEEGNDDAGSSGPPPQNGTGASAKVEAKVTTVADLQAWFAVHVESEVDLAKEMLLLAPGSSRTFTVTLVNRGPKTLLVEAEAGEALHQDARLVALVEAEGHTIAFSSSAMVLSPLSTATASVTVHAPASARLDDVVSFRQGFRVSEGNVTADGFGFDLAARIVPPEVRGDASAGATVSTEEGVGVATAVLVGVAGVGAVAGGAWLALRRDATRFAVAAALYTRLAPSRVLDHPTRDSLRQRIADAPGICYSDLQDATGLNTGALVHHLRAMERAGILASRKEGAYRRFYVVGSVSVPVAGPATVVSALTPMQQRVMDEVRAAPLTQGELAARLGLSQQGISHHVKALERGGHLVAEYDGRVWRYRPAAPSEALRP